MKRNKFALSHKKLLSCNMGELVPLGCVEVLPGDTFNHAVTALIRTAPLATPVMHSCEARIHHWYVPTRLLWANFEAFITGGPDGTNNDTPPYIDLTWAPGPPAPSGTGIIGELADYLGCPTGINNLRVSALPFRAYAMIWNNFYRDQDLQTELSISKTSGADASTNTFLQNCSWRKDYFTIARDEAQKGTDVLIPMNNLAQVEANGNNPQFDAPGAPNRFLQVDGATNHTVLSGAAIGGGVQDLEWGDETGLQAVLEAGTINELRERFAIQAFRDAMLRTGSRFTEYLAHLGVRSPDARLQLPEYLGGGSNKIQFSEVVQSAPFDDGTDVTPTGTLTGHGISGVQSNRYRKFFYEHGFVISLLSVRPQPVYMQGLHRKWSRTTKEKYFQKELQHVGPQEVLNKEIYADGSSADNDGFGFIDMYDDYRSEPSTVSGEFRDTLKDWHMAREFAVRPTLDADFVTCVPTNRIYTGTYVNQLYVRADHSLQARRILHKSGRPLSLF